MTTQTVKPNSIIPDIPRGTKLVKPDGEMDDQWKLYFQSLSSALKNILSNEGIAVPNLTAADITNLKQVNNDGVLRGSKSNIIYDSTNNLFKGNINGTWKTFTLT